MRAPTPHRSQLGIQLRRAPLALVPLSVSLRLTQRSPLLVGRGSSSSFRRAFTWPTSTRWTAATGFLLASTSTHISDRRVLAEGTDQY